MKKIDLTMVNGLVKRLVTMYYSDEYILIPFPEVQEYMTEKWFRKECYLCQAFDDQEHIDSAYFVPKERINEYNSKQLGE